MTATAQPIPTHLKGRDWLMTQDWSVDELTTALDTAEQLKAEFKAGRLIPHDRGNPPPISPRVSQRTRMQLRTPIPQNPQRNSLFE